MTDWVTISSLATAGGTLVLAVATFASVRSANRSAQLTELALNEQLRPVLVHSHLDDAVQQIMFGDGHWVRVAGAGAVIEDAGESIYLVLSLRNVGAGIGVLQGWYPWPDSQVGRRDHPPLEEFKPQLRDLYIPAGGIGLWQGRIREGDELHPALRRAHGERSSFSLDLLYSDHMGAQRTISRFSFTSAQDDGWQGAVSRHWNLDRPGPR
jgi:hypothetical protein